MLKAEYIEKHRMQDVRILAGWGEAKDLTDQERERLDLARTRLAILTAAEIVPLIARFLSKGGPQFAQPLFRDPARTGRLEFSEPPPTRRW